MSRGLRCTAAIAILLALGAWGSPAAAKKAKTPDASLTIQDADRWAGSAPGDARDKALRSWAEAADLSDLMFAAPPARPTWRVGGAARPHGARALPRE